MILYESFCIEAYAKVNHLNILLQKRVAKLQSSLEELKRSLKDAEDKHKIRLDELNPSIQRLKKETLDQEKKIDHMEWKSTMILKKFEEYDNAEKMMNKSLKRTLTSNESLE